MMRLIRYPQCYPKELGRPVVALGNFDGVHLGHQHVIRIAKKHAAHYHAPMVLFTFEPHPISVLTPGNSFARLTPLREKISCLKPYRPDVVIACPFTNNFAQMNAREFVRDILIGKLQARHIVVGRDFIFGHRRSGNPDTLRVMGSEGGFEVTQVEAIHANQKPCSSSAIRQALKHGKLRDAKALLGHDYFLIGRVLHGSGRGKGLGTATANLAVTHTLPIPFGVYVVRVSIEGEENALYGVANIGMRPSFNELTPIIEVHIFDYNTNLYGKMLQLSLLEYIRAEKKFDSVHALKDQIAQDILQAKEIVNLDK